MTRKAEIKLIYFLALGLLIILGISLQNRFTHSSIVLSIAENRLAANTQQPPVSEVGVLMQKLKEDPNDAQTLCSLSSKLIEEGNLDAAATFAEKAILRDVANPLPSYLLGYIRHRQGKEQEALELMKNSLEKKDSAAVHFSAGVICRYFLHDTAGAISHWEKGLSSPDLTESQQKQLQKELSSVKKEN